MFKIDEAARAVAAYSYGDPTAAQIKLVINRTRFWLHCGWLGEISPAQRGRGHPRNLALEQIATISLFNELADTGATQTRFSSIAAKLALNNLWSEAMTGHPEITLVISMMKDGNVVVLSKSGLMANGFATPSAMTVTINLSDLVGVLTEKLAEKARL